MGALVRDAIDRMLAEGLDANLASAEAFLSAEPLPVGEPEELSAELERTLERDEG